MIDVEAYMAFSLKSFNAQISFYLLQTFVWQQMYFTKIIEEQKHPQQEDGCGNLHCILLCISAYLYICLKTFTCQWQILYSMSGVFNKAMLFSSCQLLSKPTYYSTIVTSIHINRLKM